MNDSKQATTSTVAKINNVETVLHDTVRSTEDGYIFVEPVCKFFGTQIRNQLDRLKADRICQSDMRKNSCQLVF